MSMLSHVFKRFFDLINFMKYEDEEFIIQASVEYKRNRSIDNEMIYCAGKFLRFHERDLPTGLLGCTDTNSVIYITTKDTYEFNVPKGKVIKHELLHVQLPDASELQIRYLTDIIY